MDVIVFNQRVKHGVLDFHPGVVYGFEDPEAAPYFKAMGWANDGASEPALIIGIDELDIDPETIFADGPHKGRRVLEVAGEG